VQAIIYCSTGADNLTLYMLILYLIIKIIRIKIKRILISWKRKFRKI